MKKYHVKDENTLKSVHENKIYSEKLIQYFLSLRLP